VKTGGGVFATPGAALLPQQVQIAPLHQLRAGADQANGPVAQIMRFPAATARMYASLNSPAAMTR
jgi:hypothetical protein